MFLVYILKYDYEVKTIFYSLKIVYIIMIIKEMN